MRKIFLAFVVPILFFAQTSFANVCENINQYTLSNGHTVIVKEIKNNPIVIIDTFIKTGSVNETEQNNGVAHFLEHLFFKGTTNNKKGIFEKTLESKGAVFNAATSRDYTHYYIKIDSKHFDKALNLHADMLMNVAIPENELNMERKVVLEEITRSNDNTINRLFDNFLKIAFNGTSYQRKILGTENIISTITRDEILNFHDDWYKPQNMVTVIVGDVNSKDALEKVAKAFKCNKQEEFTIIETSTPEKANIKNNTIIEKSDVNSGYMILGYKTTGNNNIKEAYALSIAAHLLAGGQNSILYKALKENENIVTDINAGNYELKDTGVFYVSSTFEQKNYQKVLNKIQEEIELFKSSPIEEERLNLIKNSIKRQYEYSNENITNIAQMIGYDVSVGNGLCDYCNYLETVENITPEFIKETVNKYFTKENYALSVILPQKPQISNDENFRNISNKQKIKAKLISKYKDVKKYKLPNGATLLTETNENNNVVAVKIFVKGGSLAENKTGTASILADTLLKGTLQRTGKELEDALDNIGTNISISSDYQYFEVSLKTTKNDFENAFELLKEILEQPNFPEKEIENAKKDAVNAIIASRDNPQNVAFENFYELIYQNSPFLKTGKILETSIPTITTEDVKRLHKELFSAKNMIISIAGNISENDVIEKFSALKNTENFKPVNENLFKATLIQPENSTIKKEAKNSAGAWLIQGWQTNGFSNNDFVVLKLLSTYLGGGFTSKLFSNLREEKGMAYEVGASSSSESNSGIFLMYIGTKPENLEEVKKEFTKEITKLKTLYLTQKELCDLKTMLIGRLKLSTETNSAKAFRNGYYELFDKGYQFGYDYPKLIEKISVQDILEIANKYFSQPFVMSIVAEEKYLKNEKGKE